MRLWITSDWHLETGAADFDQPAPEFDVLVVAGDVSNDVRNAGWPDEMLADGSPPAVPGFVAEV